MTPEMLQSLFSQIAQACLLLIGTVISVVLVPLAVKAIKAQAAKLEVEISREQYATVMQFVRTGVQYAEQQGLLKQLEMAGTEKQKLAVSYVEGELRRRGLSTDLYPILEMIESAVLTEFNLPKLSAIQQGE